MPVTSIVRAPALLHPGIPSLATLQHEAIDASNEHLLRIRLGLAAVYLYNSPNHLVDL